MKKINAFRILGFMAISFLLSNSLIFAKVSGSSRLNPAGRDSSLLYNRVEMQEMGHGYNKNNGTKKVQNPPGSAATKNGIAAPQPVH